MTETAAQTLPCDHEGVGRPGCPVCDPAARARTYEVHATAQWTPTPQARELKHLALHVAKTAGKICSLAEKLDHGPVDPRLFLDLVGKDVPDLVILAAMFQSAVEPHGYKFDLNDAVDHRSRELARRAP